MPGLVERLRERRRHEEANLMQSLKEALAYMDGKLARQVHVYDRPRDFREAAGLTPSEMAERRGMDPEACLAWEGDLVEVVNRPPRTKSPWERLARLIAVRAKAS